MLYFYSVCLPVLVHEAEPSPHSGEQFYVLAELSEIASSELDAVFLRLIEHQLHISQDVACILTFRYAVAHCPEFGGGGSYRLDETELLHVAGGEGAVEIVNQSDNWFLSHIIFFVPFYHCKKRSFWIGRRCIGGFWRDFFKHVDNCCIFVDVK